MECGDVLVFIPRRYFDACTAATTTAIRHAPANFGRTFAIATALNVALVIAQVVYGLFANSLALLADAGHNFGDVMGLVLAWGAFAVADWRPSARFTYRHARGLDPLRLRQRHDPAGRDRRHRLGSGAPLRCSRSRWRPAR